MLRTTAVTMLAAVCLVLTACTDASSARDRDGGDAGSDAGGSVSRVPSDLAADEVAPSGTATDVVTGLDAPWSVVVVGSGSGSDGSVLVSERDSADVLELRDGATRTVGRIDGVQHGGEGGLLGLAVDDTDPDAPRLYTYSTTADGNRIERYALRGDPGSYTLGARTTILDGLPANSFHNGGRIALGPDGMLYASVGDAGDGDDAQDRSSLAGKILRMTPDGDVPADNPFDDSLVWSLGHRNVQGLGWAADGTMFASEFGQDTWDELNVIEPGADYGWPEVEGKGGGSGFVDPVQQWRTDDASPSGLAVVGDTVFVANLQGRVVRGIPVADPSGAHEYFAGEYGRIRTVLAGPGGDLWFVTNNTDGRGDPAAGDDRIVSVGLRSSEG
ncbi:glucose dehydrogenase [Curtobacterium sp. Leaf261]|nr:glucose dehydrogenase [Curtobacterium sp. Leaf261]